MPDKDTLICYCHDLTIAQIAEYIKANDIQRWEEIVEDKDYVCGNSCENCHTEGYQNDGFSLAMVVGMVKKGYI